MFLKLVTGDHVRMCNLTVIILEDYNLQFELHTLILLMIGHNVA
jgi:hypothetical protein